MRDDSTAAGWLEQVYQKAKGGQVAFVDEAYRGFERRHEAPFYIATAVVVDTRYMEEMRENLAHIAGGTYWHTTEQMRTPDGPARIVEMLKYLADGDEVCTMSIQHRIDRADRDLETARRDCLTGLARALHRGQPVTSNTMVIEKRASDSDRKQDARLLPDLIKHGHVDGRFRIHQASPSEDRLLWLPDLVAHAARRKQALRRPELYDLIEGRVVQVEPVSIEPAPQRSTPDRSIADLLNDATPRRRSTVKKTAVRPPKKATPPSVQFDAEHHRDVGIDP